MATGSLVFEISMQRYNKKSSQAKLDCILVIDGTNWYSFGIDWY